MYAFYYFYIVVLSVSVCQRKVRTTSNGIAPDIFPFRSSKHHSHFRLNHPDVPDGREFYVVIKSIGKSGIDGLLEKIRLGFQNSHFCIPILFFIIKIYK
jgi:hypothetical protein